MTNIDIRENEGFNVDVKFRLSLLMLRNIDKMRANGVMAQPEWLNKHVLMVDEAI